MGVGVWGASWRSRVGVGFGVLSGGGDGGGWCWGQCWGVGGGGGGGGGGGWLSGRERERVERGRVNRIIYFYISAVSVLYHIPRQIPLPVTEGYSSKGLQDSENLTFHCTSEYTPAPHVILFLCPPPLSTIRTRSPMIVFFLSPCKESLVASRY